MKFEKLNSLAAVHRYRPTEFTFSDVYAEASQLLLKTHIHMILKIRGVTLHDAQETFHDALLAAFDRRKEEGFGEALSALLKLKRMERHRSTVRRNERFKLTLDASIEHEDGTFTPMNEPVDEVLTEDEALKTKDAQKRQLLDILADRANDPVAKKIATHMVELTGSKQFLTDTALAKELNMCHKTVGRKLSLLARQYRPEKDGDIRDYFPIGIRVKKEFISA
ncbi:hypothetical protein MHB71_04830 [Paenibacillus sp. FSL H7-0940]|uniref:hypothetical protein n=1 Tax=Paenibacillus sp. FSL H7-0940 TaxID=2921443 RepID=UPI0030EF4522